MATLFITEFSGLASVPGGGGAQMASLPPLVEQTVAVGAEADASPFGSQTRYVRLVTDAACHVKVARSAPAATTASMYLPANSPEYFGVQPDDTLSVIAAV